MWRRTSERRRRSGLGRRPRVHCVPTIAAGPGREAGWRTGLSSRSPRARSIRELSTWERGRPACSQPTTGARRGIGWHASRDCNRGGGSLRPRAHGKRMSPRSHRHRLILQSSSPASSWVVCCGRPTAARAGAATDGEPHVTRTCWPSTRRTARVPTRPVAPEAERSRETPERPGAACPASIVATAGRSLPTRHVPTSSTWPRHTADSARHPMRRGRLPDGGRELGAAHRRATAADLCASGARRGKSR